MYKEIELKTLDGVKTFKFLSNGITSYRYRQVFNDDLMIKLSNFDKNIDYSLADRLAFIMNAQAEGKDMKTLNQESFYNWIEQFESMELLNNLEKITEMYLGAKITQSVAKKN